MLLAHILFYHVRVLVSIPLLGVHCYKNRFWHRGLLSFHLRAMCIEGYLDANSHFVR